MSTSKEGETKLISKTNATDTMFNLNSTEISTSKEGELKCPIHSNEMLEFFCSSCKKTACNNCQHVVQCHEKKHEVISMKNALEIFNLNATELIQTADDTVNKLTEIFTTKNSDFENDLKLCKIAIENQEQRLIKNIKDHARALISDLEKIYNEMKIDNDNRMKHLDSTQSQVQNLKTEITAMNNPEQTETLALHRASINAVRKKIKGNKFICTRDLTPFFTPSKHLDELMKTEGIGSITTFDSNTYKVAEGDDVITVTKGQEFVVKLLSPTQNANCQFAVTLLNSSGEESPTEIEYQEGGEYKITGSCHVEGDWQMKITLGSAHIKGSPVNVKVEKLGLVHTIENISDYKEHSKESKVTDVMLDRDGCMLVSSYSKDVLKFNQSGSFVARIQLPKDVKVNRMHQMDDGQTIYSDELRKRMVICDDKFQKIHSVNNKLLKHPMGLTVNNETRFMYVADHEAHCVFKFNVDDGRLLGKIDSKSSEYIKQPNDVTLTKEGHVIIADFESNIIQMFDADDKFMRILLECGEEDGKVLGPGGVTMDMDENIIVSSNHKLQLFDKDGVFIKRIDHEDDGLDVPAGIAVISTRPRRVAVANHRKNNVKIFNY
ncbi:tripartite motif-containing protein 2-like [Anneissia japonica]|uniref:tripartite motif-containing protein 2-like n=1 Tax=Anneissia japonica TaxID=1529436 RepID=UPI001425B84A|nr:tripartite motif-containing protein 2-like [Anneissia japonica]